MLNVGFGVVKLSNLSYFCTIKSQIKTMMNFIEIFNQDGLYTAKQFSSGVALKITMGYATLVEYKSPSDLLPGEIELSNVLGKQVVNYEYTKVLNINQLFNKK